MSLLRYLFLAFALLSCGRAAPGLAAGTANQISARLVSETQRPAPGRTFAVALAMDPAPGWHGYWKNPGDAGMETRITWRIPKGIVPGPLVYPVPGRLLISGLMNHVYEGPYAHLIEIAVPGGAKPGASLPISADVEWLACSDILCVPERATLALDLVIGDGAIDAADRARFDRIRAALPRPLGQAGRFAHERGKLRLAIPLPSDYALLDPWLFLLTHGVADYAAPQSTSRVGDELIVETAAATGVLPDRIEGVLATGKGGGLEIHAAPGHVPPAGAPLADTETSDPVLFLLTFGAAVLGGILLNIMPCVFPILSLKALSLARAGETPRQARRDALAYAAGVILVCLALGVVLLVLRSGGAALGWAFQLQDPRVILLLLLLVIALGFNLAGLFELPVLAGRGATGAFATGALAAFVATPCTGPFMATALGAALVLPAAAVVIFFGLGLGIALPFLALGFVPGLRTLLPRPGPWMTTMRHILAVPMFATALGCAWILGRQAGVDAMAVGLGAVVLLGLGLWWGGARQMRGRDRAWWPALALILLALATVAAIPRSAPPAAVSDERFSEARLAALRTAGRPVFVYFTADWCLTCKVNESAAIGRAEVREAFARAGVATLVGDWTRGDPAIGRFLAAHGRSGVPLYLFYPKGGGPARELPQILSQSMLVEVTG